MIQFLPKSRRGLLTTALVPLLFTAIQPDAAMAEMRKAALESHNGSTESARQTSVSGIIKDSRGETLVGVTVKVKGTNQGTVSDINGGFRLNVERNAVLVVSYVGFDTQEIPVDGRNVLNVTLKESNSTLDEIVVIGYGVAKKKDLTGAVASVKSEDIALSPVSSPMEALQGRVSGLDIQRESGRAGEAPAVLLRGNRSLKANQSPLYIIDGIEGSITELNPNDIETIDVLKDASSTAIYGARGANGVIMITTKKAKAGKVQIDLNSYYGVNGFASYPEPLTGEAWLDYHRDRFFIEKGYEATSLSDLGFTSGAIKAIENGQWVNWVDETLQTGTQQNHHLSLRGGTEKVQGYLSLGFIGEKGIYENDQIDIYNSRGGIDLQVSKMFKAGFQSVLDYRTRNTTDSRINRAFSVYPLGVPYDENGIINLHPIADDPNTINILANNYPGALVNESRNYNIRFNPYIEVSPIEGLKFRSNFGAHLSSGRTGKFANKNSFTFLNEGKTISEASYSTSQGYSYIWDNILSYNFDIAKDHSFGITAITSWADSRNEGSDIAGSGLDYDDFLFYNVSALSNLTARSNLYTQTKRMSYAGRFNYSYKGKYLLQATNRWDGVSQLAEGNKWSSFPSVSLAWRVSDEPFMETTKSWLDNLKLRAGYGVSGLAAIDPYVSLTRTTTKTGNLSLGGATALPVYTPTEYITNPDLTWERAANTNIGLDFSVFGNRVDVTAEYYYTKTTGIIWDRRMPFHLGGFDAKTPYKRMSNIGTSQNKGIEIAIGSRNIVKRDFQWNSNLTFTKGSEKLTDIDLGKLAVDQLVSENLFIDQPVKGVFYGYKKIGIWQLGEEEEAAKYGAQPGDLKLQTVPQIDANGESDNGVHPYSAKDRMVVGNNVPDWHFGFQNSFNYKNFDLTVFVNARYGQMIRAELLGYWNRMAQPASYNYWTVDNPTNDYPRPGGKINSDYESSLLLVDGSYIKVKNITLGYTLPTAVGSKVGFSRLRVYGTVYNPFIFTRNHLLKDVDPENGGADSFPLFKQVVFGINLSL